MPDRGEWLAAFAPVGETGYVVVVQTETSKQSLLLPKGARWRSMALQAGMLLLIGASLIVLIPVHRRRRLRARPPPSEP
jgi:hypothetical protein